MLSLEEYVARFGAIQAGPCAGCGTTGYGLSMGGPSICPACDCMPPERRVKDLAAENRRLRELLAEHGITDAPPALKVFGSEEE
jgi:hypothetical protein